MSTMTAATSTAPFFIYIHNIRNDDTWRIVIKFQSRDVADQWWRAMQVAKGSSGQSLNVQRLAPQWYTHDPDVTWNVYNFFIDAQTTAIATLFRGKMFLVLENNRAGRGMSIILTEPIVDHVSGSWFTIRSKSNPNKYWYVNPNTGSQNITVSDVHRTSFKVSGVGLTDGTILIGTDQITLWAESGSYVGALPPSNILTLTGPNAGTANTFTFQNFAQGDFIASLDDTSPIYYNVNGGPRGWELAL